MAFVTDCVPCQHGRHEDHYDVIEAVPEGVMGGAICGCRGECLTRPKPKHVISPDLPPLSEQEVAAMDEMIQQLHGFVVAEDSPPEPEPATATATTDPEQSLTLEVAARERAAAALSAACSDSRFRAHVCAQWMEDGSCSVCWETAAAVIRAAEGLRECPRCQGGGLVAPGDCCPSCGGNGLAVLEGFDV